MTLRIKACGLNEIDKSSLKSMLSLAAELLSHPWLLTEDANAELKVYCFDYPEGLSAWQQRQENGLSALLTSQGNVTEAVDIIIKKPLRTANFSEALNLIDEQIRGPKPKKITPIAATRSTKALKPGSPSKLVGWASLFNKKLLARRKPASDLPPLNVKLAGVESTKKADTFTDPLLLATWLQQLPADPHQKISTLLSHLQTLSGLNLTLQKNLLLLDEYRQTLHNMIFERDSAALRADNRQLTEKRKFLRQFQKSLHLLAAQYLRCAWQQYQRGQRPADNNDYLLCLLRSTELLALQILHAYQHYQQQPADVLWQLHQLYLYLEAAGCLKRTPEFKKPQEISDFCSLYNQILVTGVADPYSMPRFAVNKMFQLLPPLISGIDISLLSEKQMQITSQFLLTGHFCIDCQADILPQAMARTAPEIRAAKTTRLLNVQPLLQEIDKLIKREQQKLTNIEKQLLNQTIPQLNGSYERRSDRLMLNKPRTVGINYGLKSIHSLLSDDLQATQQQWLMLNEGVDGLMLSRNTADCKNIQIGDLVAISESSLLPKLGVVRWLHIGPDQTQLGLALLNGEISAGFCMPNGEATEMLALLLAESDKHCLLTEKGLFTPKRKLRLKTNDQPSLIEAGQLYDSTLDYDYFNYKALKIS
ncbi:MAG: hypothetical protein RQ732_01430 [Methylophaga sp.]|nr:hypothetical protein [Methylophaga sp.]